jgi:hypothetical protein
MSVKRRFQAFPRLSEPEAGSGATTAFLGVNLKAEIESGLTPICVTLYIQFAVCSWAYEPDSRTREQGVELCFAASAA